MVDVLPRENVRKNVHRSKLRFSPVWVLWCIAIGSYLLAVSRALLWVYAETEAITTILPIIIAAVISLIVLIWKFGWPTRTLPYLPQSLIALCAILSFWTFPILQQLSAAFALLGMYGFFAGFARVAPELWRKGFILAGLGALALPFALVPGTGFGFYLRLVTADTAAQLLGIMGHTSLGAHDVLIFDNGIAQVDIPCSGLKSLFTGTAFFLAASLILRRSVTLGWLLAYSIFIGLMLIANTVRVTLLIWISEILEMRSFAEHIHMPIGLVLFCAVCVAGVYMLLKTRPYSPDDDTPKPVGRWHRASLLVLLIGLTGLTLLKPVPLTPMDTKLTPLPGLNTTEISLTQTEKNFFAARTQTRAAKWTFSYKTLSGSMLVVRSRAANGLHAPEVCMLGNGISVQSMDSMPLAGNASYRWLTVDEARRNAVYWMQSGDIITDDFRVRLSKYILSGHRAKNRDWTMVTLLFDQRHNPDTQDIQTLMGKLQKHYALNADRQE